MFLVLLPLAVLFVLAVIWHRRLKIRRRDDLPDVVRALLILMANGGIYRLNHIGSDFWFSFERVSGAGGTAVLALRIPRVERTIVDSDNIVNAFTRQGFQVVSETDNPSLIARILISVDDIWDKACGSNGSHAARILLETVRIPSTAKFRLVEFGDPSKRALRNKEFLKNG